MSSTQKSYQKSTVSKTENHSVQKNVLYTAVLLTGLIIISVIILPSSDPFPVNTPLVKNTSVTQTTKSIEANVPTSTNTIATVWQWENENNNPQTETPSIDQPGLADTPPVLPFTEESVYKTLHAVKLDDNGDIIIDNDALIALDAALNHSKLKLDDETLEELQNLIKKGLPGNAGEQTAQIVADYYQYLGAKNEFNALYNTTNNVEQNIDDYETQYNELLALRELYLGAEIAAPLFKTANANARYMFDSMKLEANTDLNEEEKKEQQAQIIERHAAKTISVNNWNERFQAFSDDKQNILNASISDDEKRNQLTALMHQHFNYEELDDVHHLQLDSL